MSVLSKSISLNVKKPKVSLK